MPAQTRSRGKPPPSQVYHSSPPLQQAHFPTRRRIVKTYGRNRRTQDLKQETITQMDYLTPIDPDEMDADILSEAGAQPRNKRRKTMGDAPSSSVESSFHTQTLTQLYSEKGDIEVERQSDDSVEEDDRLGVPGSETARQMKGEHLNAKEEEDVSPIAGPQTPSTKMVKTEIPSSQPSPFTPMFARYSPLGAGRSPLKDKSTTAGAQLPDPLPAPRSRGKTPRNMVIQDSYSTANSSNLSTPSRSSRLSQSSDKENRRSTGSQKKRARPPIQPSRTPLKELRSAVRPLEIPDSDDELASLGPTPQKATMSIAVAEDSEASDGEGSPTPAARRCTQAPSLDLARTDSPSATPHCATKTGDTPDTNAHATGGETDEHDELESLSHTPSKPTESHEAPNKVVEAEVTEADLDFEPETPCRPSRTLDALQERHCRDSDAETASPSPRKGYGDGMPSSLEAVEETPISSPHRTSPAKNAKTARTPAKTQACTQGLESQRIPLEMIRAMAPQTDRSDIILSIHPGPVAQIVEGTKDHEFRNYRIPQIVSRIWIYVTRPVCELKYMATVGHAKEPGEIDSNTGFGNADFNRGQASRFAYELLQVYELNNPVTLQVMKQNGWMGGPPQKYVYIPPAVVGQLLSNLRCALFEEVPAVEEGGTVSQELEAQLRSDITHATQAPSPDVRREPRSSVQKGANDFDNSTGSGNTVKSSPPLAAASRKRSAPDGENRPSQATTASGPSSPVAESPEKFLRRPASYSSIPSFPDYVDDSPIRMPERYSLGSSSQELLPESLVGEDVRKPPVIWDSENEEEM